MSLKTRIIPILLTDGRGNVVKPVKFQRPYRIVGSLMQHIRVMEKRNIDELIIIDIEATKEERLIDAEKIKSYTKELYCPVTLGGGIKYLEDINKLLNAGADKVAFRQYGNFVDSAASKFGSQAIVIPFDVYYLTTNMDYVNYVNYISRRLEERGAGELLLTDTEKEGTFTGYNIDMFKDVSFGVKIPIIINGGCGEPSHMLEAIKAGAHAVAASSMFLYKDHTPRDCAKYLIENGVQCRVE